MPSRHLTAPSHGTLTSAAAATTTSQPSSPSSSTAFTTTTVTTKPPQPQLPMTLAFMDNEASHRPPVLPSLPTAYVSYAIFLFSCSPVFLRQMQCLLPHGHEPTTRQQREASPWAASASNLRKECLFPYLAKESFCYNLRIQNRKKYL